MGDLAWAAWAAAALGLLAWRWRRRRLHEMAARMSGPPTWPIVGNALQVGVTTVDFYETIQKFCTAYGPVFRVWLGPLLYIVLLKPKDLEIVMSSSKYIDKAFVYRFIHPWLGRGLLTSSGAKWHKHRKLITPTFHFKILDHFLEPISAKAVTLIKLLEKHVNGPSIDIYSYITVYSLDTITETAMGLDIDAQRDTNSLYVNAVKTESAIIMRRMMRPWFYPDVIFNMFSDGRNQKKALQVLHDTTRMVIQRKQKELTTKLQNADSNCTEENTGGRRRLAFLDLLLQENMTSGALSEEDLQAEVDTFMFEGHDTTASGLSFTLWLLSRHEDVQEKAYSEIESLLKKTGDNTNIQVLNEMKYLECVIKESLRLYPPVPLIGREINEDVLITDDIVLPAHSSLAIPVAAIHRNPDIYPNPDDFIPERFLLEKKDAENSFAFIPFSAGSRNCIGQKFAMFSMKATISKILSSYKLLPDTAFEPVLSAELILKSTNGLKLKIASRAS